VRFRRFAIGCQWKHWRVLWASFKQTCANPFRHMSKRSPWRFCYCVYFFDDVREDPAELRRSILLFLGATRPAKRQIEPER